MREQVKKILIVEDESIIGMYLKSTLIQIGYDVVSVAISGEQALQQVKRTLPDLILMDINLPGDLDGIETAEHIRSAHDLPIIYLTANSDDSFIERAKLTDPLGYLIKPVHAKELRVTIEMALYKHQMERSLKITNQHLEKEILERKRVEQELEKHRGHLEVLVRGRTIELEVALNRLRIVIETVGEGITLSDERGYFEVFNSKMEQITGYTQEEANQSSNFLRLLYPQTQDYHQTLFGLQEILRNKGTRDIETTIIAKDGSQKILLVSTSLIYDQNRMWYLSAYRDITARKRAEEELTKAKEAAEVANLAKSRFLANMSHELRTPLNAIMGYAQIFKTADNLTDRQIDGLETIRSSGDHLLRLINEVLDLSKVEAGKLELQRKEFHLPNFLAQIVKMMRIQAEQRNLVFLYTQDSDLPLWIYADEQRLSEILMNLLGNAIKFTDQGQINFRVKMMGKALNHISSHTVTIRFEVEDTGIGIAPERFEEIFLPFQQIAFRRSSTQGTGLGLTISRKFVEMMGGTLHVSSTVGQGSLFTFELTFPEILGVLPAEHSHAPNILGYTGDRRTILVVDDHKENRAVVADRLTSIGFHVLEAEDGQECLDLALTHAPHAILLDLQMPAFDGFEVAQLIQTFPELRDVVVIAISASVYQEVRLQSLQSGCREFLAKPIHFPTLLECLRGYLHLEWIYQEHSDTSECGEQPANALPSEPVLLSPSVREKLLELAELGIAKTLLAELRTLETQDARFHPLAEHLRQFVKAYQFDQLIEFLHTHKEAMGE